MNIPRHPIERRMFLPIFPKSEPCQLQKKYATAWKVTKDIIFDLFVMVIYTILVKYTCLLIYNNQIYKLMSYHQLCKI